MSDDEDLLPFDEPEDDEQSSEEQFIVEEAVKATLPMTRPGRLIPYDWLDDALDLGARPRFTVDADNWRLLRVRRYKRWKDTLLEEHNVLVINVKGQGFRVVPPNKYGYVATGTINKTTDKLSRYVDSVFEHTPIDQLTPGELVQHRMAEAKSQARLEAMRRARPRAPRPGERQSD